MLDEPMANSSMLALPRNTAPSRSRFAVTVLSYGGTNGDRMRLPAVVRTPLRAEQVLDRERNAGERACARRAPAPRPPRPPGASAASGVAVM